MSGIAGAAVRGACVLTLVCGALLQPAASASAALPPIKHVFVVIDENEAAATTFGPGSPAPYLSQTLVAQGAYLPNYYGIGHSSLDNYIAMVSGQAPNPSTSGDCPTFADFPAPTSMDAAGQENGQGCVYPANVPTLMSQLVGAGLTWRAYEDGMGADPTRESATCGHPTVGSPDNTEGATQQDQYATRHDPFVYFHSVIDNRARCNADVVNLDQLAADLRSAATTPNYVFITPNLCDDGHDANCANGGPGGLAQADAFLKTWVPQITSSPAFKQNGLLIITIDESVGDATACCGEMPGPYDQANNIMPGGVGPGGGVVGAVLLSPFIAPGTRSKTPYNHYSMLGSVEDLFGLPRLAGATGTVGFGSDLYTKPRPVAPQDSGLTLKPRSFAPQSAAKTLKHRGTTIGYSDSEAGVTMLTVQRIAPGYRLGHQACKALNPGDKRPKHSEACTVTKTVARFTHRDTVGSNRLPFTGRVQGRSLTAGSYLLNATPVLGRLTGPTRTAKFHVV
jgi:phosphatidylinositol-3-phosphatase